MALLRQVSALRTLQPAGLRAMFSAQAATSSKFYDVPEGHAQSDLSQATCNIGLNRRRDLTLGAAAEIKLTVNGQPVRLADLFKDKKTVLFGVPDCGKVCSEQHVPGYLKEWDELRAQGINQILCVAVGDAAAAQAWAKGVGIDGDRIALAVDPNQAATRLMGMELGSPDAPGPRSLRYAAILDNGVILKVKVDKSPADVKESSAASVVATLKSMFH